MCGIFNGVVLAFVTASQVVLGMILGSCLYLVYGLGGNPFAWLVLGVVTLCAIAWQALLLRLFRWALDSAVKEDDWVWQRVMQRPRVGRLLVFGPFLTTTLLMLRASYESIHVTPVSWAWPGIFLSPAVALVGWLIFIAKTPPLASRLRAR